MPERLLPHHLGNEVREEEQPATEASTTVERNDRKERKDTLRKATSLETILEEHLKEKGLERPEKLNLSLIAIEEFQRYVREAQDLRRVVLEATGVEDRLKALRVYTDKKKKIDEYLAQGASFESAYREYIKKRTEYIAFMSTLRQMKQLQNLLGQPSFASLPETSELSDREIARLEMVMHSKTPEVTSNEELEALKSIYGPDTKEYAEVTELFGNDETSPEEKNQEPELKTKAEVEKKLKEVQKKSSELWDDPMVRYFWKKRELDQLLADFASGEDVLETQSVVRELNLLHEWEMQHQRTTIGGVLVGPPGVGKTTLVRHYLEQQGREYAYIDLSEDVTRYLLYGSKSLEFKDSLDQYETLAKRLGSLDDKALKKWVKENSQHLKDTFGAKEDEVAVMLVAQLNETIDIEGKDAPPELHEKISQLREKVSDLCNKVYRKELASEFGHLVKHNGWRDGMIIAALRRNDSVIMDEFTKNKNWSLVYSLLTAKPGEKWYFADNDEYIQIPEDWRMYFTANIGRKHGGFTVAEALASRAGGKVMEVDYAPKNEEIRVALAVLSNAEGDFLRPREDLTKLYILINEAFPSIRSFIKDKQQSIPLSYRTLRDLGEKLILYRDSKSDRSVYQPTKKTFDEALYDVIVESYSLYEDKTVPHEIVNLLTSVGLLLDPKVKDRVLSMMDEKTYDDRVKAFHEHQKDFKEIEKHIRSMNRNVADMAMPVGRTF